jgi:hypothetical protein
MLPLGGSRPQSSGTARLGGLLGSSRSAQTAEQLLDRVTRMHVYRFDLGAGTDVSLGPRVDQATYRHNNAVYEFAVECYWHGFGTAVVESDVPERARALIGTTAHHLRQPLDECLPSWPLAARHGSARSDLRLPR